MAEKTFHCRLITPEDRLLDVEATYVSLPLHDGLAGFQSQHAPLVARLGLGELRIDLAGGKSHSFFLDGGFGQFVGDNLTILAEEAIPSGRINEQDAKAELQEANSQTGQTGEELTRVVHERSRAALKVRLAEAAKKSA